MKSRNFKQIMLIGLVLLVSNVQAGWGDWLQKVCDQVGALSTNQKVAVGIGLIGVAAVAYYFCTGKQEYATQERLFGLESPGLTGFAVQYKQNNTGKDMQDRYYASQAPGYKFYAVFDGHGPNGHYIAQYLVDNLCKNIVTDKNFDQDPKKAILNGCHKTNLLLKKDPKSVYSGSTATFVLIKDNKVYVGNVGDSRTILSSNNLVIPLSIDHNTSCECELERIKKIGGRLLDLQGVLRVFGNSSALLVTRAFGDFDVEKGVICTPEIHEREIVANDQFLILASDGIWDHIDNQSAVNLVHAQLQLALDSIYSAVENLADIPYQDRVRHDDRIVMIVKLN